MDRISGVLASVGLNILECKDLADLVKLDRVRLSLRTYVPFLQDSNSLT